jgi:hypothetical protein
MNRTPSSFRILSAVSLMVFSFHAASASIAVLSDLSDEHRASPGETYTGSIQLRNLGNDAEEVKIYQTDYLFNSNGTSFYNEPGSGMRSNAKWIEFSPKRVSIPGNEDAAVQFTVKVPAADSLSGTYWSILMVEPIPKTSPEAERSEPHIGITAVMRYAVQLVTNVGPEGIRKINFMGSKLVSEDSKRIFQVDLENTGTVMVRPQVTVQLFDSTGKSFGPFESEKLRIYPGTSIRHRFDLSGISAGNYKALVVADCGEENVFGIHYTLRIEK